MVPLRGFAQVSSRLTNICDTLNFLQVCQILVEYFYISILMLYLWERLESVVQCKGLNLVNSSLTWLKTHNAFTLIFYSCN